MVPKMRVLTWIAAIFLIGMLVAVGVYATARNDKAVTVTGVAASRGAIKSYIKATGFVASRHEIPIAGPVSGTVTRLPFAIGQRIDRAQVVAEFDRREANERVRTAQATLRQAEEELLQTRRNHAATQKILEAGGESQLAVDDARSAVVIATAKRDRAQSELRAAELAQTMYSLAAPVSGVAIASQVHVGEFVPAGKVLLTIAALNDLEVLLKVDQAVAELIKPGQAVQLMSETQPDVVIATRIDRVEPSIQKDGTSDFLAAWASLDTREVTAKLNQQLGAQILVASRDNVLRIPLDAVFDKARKDFVRVIDGGRLRYRPIKTGIQDGQYVEILSGIDERQVVLLPNPKVTLNEGDRVQLAADAGQP